MQRGKIRGDVQSGTVRQLFVTSVVAVVEDCRGLFLQNVCVSVDVKKPRDK